jgi:hypothetical protein
MGILIDRVAAQPLRGSMGEVGVMEHDTRGQSRRQRMYSEEGRKERQRAPYQTIPINCLLKALRNSSWASS